MGQTRIDNKDIKKPLTEENITLASGISVLPNVSGQSNVGSTSLKFGTVYADNFVGNLVMSGSFVHTSGDTMTGNLTLSGANIYAAVSGQGNIGQPTVPINNVFANALTAATLTLGGVSIDDRFVNVSGDTMTGSLTLSSGNIAVNNGTITSSGNIVSTKGYISTTIGDIIASIGNVVVSAGQLQASYIRSAGAGISILDTNGAGGVVVLGSVGNPAGTQGIVSLSAGAGLNRKGQITLNAAGATGGYLEISGNTLLLNGVVDILNTNSGLNNIGSASKPFSNVYANNLIGPSGGYLNTAGGQMDGTLNFADAIGITFDGSGTSDIGALGFPAKSIYAKTGYFTNISGMSPISVQSDLIAGTSGTQNIGSVSNPFNAIYANSIVSTGTAGDFVNVSGDTMTGSLTLTSGLAVIMNPVIVGSGNIANGTNSSAVGYSNTANGTNSAAFGYTNVVSGSNSSAVGYSNTANGTNSAAFGYSNTANGSSSTAFGLANTVNGNFSSAFGFGNVANSSSLAVGSNNTASGGSFSAAVGYGNIANGLVSLAVGYQNTATVEASLAVGTANTATGINSAAVGYTNTANGANSSSVGSVNTANGANSSSVGSNNTATGTNSSAFGYNNTANGTNSSAVGYSNTANGANSSSVGNINTTNGISSFAFGYTNTAAGYNSSAVGNTNTANGEASLAVGYNNIATGTNSSVVGYQNTANGEASSAVGFTNTAAGYSSTAVGYANTATGTNSSAFGYQNTANGINSSAFGYTNTANGSGTAVFGTSVTGALDQTLYLGAPSGVMIQTGKNLLPEASGTQNIGTLALPFSGVYALSVNDRVIIVSKVNEVPTGNISSGTNTIFTLTQSPYGTSLSLFKNGLLTTPSGLYAGVGDYVLSGGTINFMSAPISGSILLATYGYTA